MEQYFLANLSEGESGIHITTGSQISQQEYTQLFECFSFTGFYKICRSIKDMTLESADDIEKFLYTLQQSDIPIDESQADKQLTTGNKLLINFLSFIKTFFDVIKHAISQRSAADAESFSNLNKALYDEFLGYRFFARMRNYVVHYNMPLTIMEDTIESGAFMYCDRDQLLQYNGWSTVQKEIEQLPARINIIPYIAEAKVAISTLYLKSLETIVISAIEASEKISEVCERNKITSPVIVIAHDNAEVPTVKMFPLQSLKEFFIDLKDHPHYELEISQDKIKVTSI